MRSPMAPTALASINEVGPHLRAWRDTRGISQLDLSLDIGMSQRQISFIETGRSVPARANLLRIANALDVPFRERNTLLLAAGYAPLFEKTGLSDARMQPITRRAADAEAARAVSGICPRSILERHDEERRGPALPLYFL